MAIERNAAPGSRLPRRRRPSPESVQLRAELANPPSGQIDSVIAALTAPEPYVPVVVSQQAEPEKPDLGHLVTPELPAQLAGGALDAAEAEAEQLRAQLAEVRKLLGQDGGVPPGPAPAAPPQSPGGGRHRRRLAAVVAVCAVGVLVATAIATDAFGLAKDDASVTPTSRPTATQTPSGLPTSGPGVSEPGTALGVQLLTDRSLAVTEQVLVPAGTGTDVTFVLDRPSKQDVGGDAASLKPAVDSVRATVDGTLAGAEQEGDTVTVPTGGGAHRIVLSYRLTGAVGTSSPSEQGRALGLVLPMTTPVLAGKDVAIQVLAGGVRNVVCAGTSSAQALCATQQDDAWLARVPAGADSPALLLQIDLE